MPDDTIRDRIGDFWDGLLFRLIGTLASLMTKDGRDTFHTIVFRGLEADIEALRQALPRVEEADE